MLRGVIERLDRKRIASAEQFARASIPQSKSEHSIELFQHARTPLAIALQQNFSIRACLETGISRQLLPQLNVVIYFTVESDGDFSFCMFGLDIF